MKDKIRWVKSSDGDWYAKVTGRTEPFINIEKKKDGFQVSYIYNKNNKWLGLVPSLALAKKYAGEYIKGKVHIS